MKMVIGLCLFALPVCAQSKNPAPKKPPESLWEKVLRITGVSSTPTALRGEDQVASGDIWLAPAVSNPTPQRLTRDGGYTSPVFDPKDGSILALKADGLYRVPLAGAPAVKILSLDGVAKLVGFSRENPDELLVLTNGAGSGPGVALLSIQTGATTAIPYDPKSDKDQAMLAHLAGWERVFDGVRLYCDEQEMDGPGGSTIRFTDVYFQRGNEAPIDLSNGKGVSSCQPYLSTSGDRVAFIRRSR